MDNSEEFVGQLKEHWFFSQFSNDEFTALVEKSTSVSYRKRETIAKKGEFATHLVFIEKGYVKIEIEQGNKTFILDIVPSGNIVGMPVALSTPKHTYSVVPLTDTDIRFFPIETVRSLLEKNGKLALAAIDYSNSSFILPMLDKLQSISQNNIRGRLAKLLLHLSSSTYSSNTFSLLITRYEIAQMIGFSRENVIRILTELHTEGVIEVNGKQINIVNAKRLVELARYS